MSEVVTVLVGLLSVLGVAAFVRIVAAETSEVYYPVLLVVVGVVISVVGLDPGFRLSSEVIRTILLPTVLFQGAQQTKSEHFWQTLPIALFLTVIGIPIAVLLLGFFMSEALQFPVAITLLLATIIYPIDPVAIIATFREASAAERVSVLAETEGHLSEGIAIVIFWTILDLISQRATTAEEVVGILGPGDLAGVGAGILTVSLGGVLVGVVAGAVAIGILRYVNDRMAELLVIVVLPYTSYLVAEESLHVSGILATVAAGLFVGTYGQDAAIHPDNAGFIERTWDTAAFLVFTLVFVMLGVQVPFGDVLSQASQILIASALLLLVRAVIVYGLLTMTNLAIAEPIPRHFQHVLVWGGMHTVVPVTLFLFVPRDFPFVETIGPIVFGVAVLSIVVQGLLLPFVLRLTGAHEEAIKETGEETVEEAMESR